MWIALSLCLVALATVWRVEVLLRLFVPRWFDVREAAAAREHAIRTTPSDRNPLPPDLEAVAARETEGWAREQVRAALQDAYESANDWDTVRAAYLGATE